MKKGETVAKTGVPFVFVNVAWGEEFVRLLTDVALPCMLTPGNFPSAVAGRECEYRYYTRRIDERLFTESAAYERLTALMPVEIRRIDQLLDMDEENPHLLLSACHRDAIESAKGRDAALVFLCPDIVVNDGMIGSLCRLVDAGKNAILTIGLRLVKETFVREYRDRYISNGEVSKLTARELVRTALPHLHDITLTSIVGHRPFTVWPSVLYWRVPGRGLLAHCFHLHPIVIRFVNKEAVFTDTIDGDLMRSAVPDASDIHIVTDSDELLICELSPGDRRFPVGGTDDVAGVAGWAIKYADAHHREYFTSPLKIHADDLDEAWSSVAGEARCFVDKVLACVKTPSRLWLMSLISSVRVLPGFLWGVGAVLLPSLAVFLGLMAVKALGSPFHWLGDKLGRLSRVRRRRALPNVWQRPVSLLGKVYLASGSVGGSLVRLLRYLLRGSTRAVQAMGKVACLEYSALLNALVRKIREAKYRRAAILAIMTSLRCPDSYLAGYYRGVAYGLCGFPAWSFSLVSRMLRKMTPGVEVDLGLAAYVFFIRERPGLLQMWLSRVVEHSDQDLWPYRALLLRKEKRFGEADALVNEHLTDSSCLPEHLPSCLLVSGQQGDGDAPSGESGRRHVCGVRRYRDRLGPAEPGDKMTETREPQYQRQVVLRAQVGLATLGLVSNQLYHDDPRHIAFLLSRYKFVSKMLSGYGSVLEVGCGDAFGSRLVQQEVNSLTAVDFDPVFVADVNERMSADWPIECFVHDMTSGPVPGGPFDAAYSLDVLEHVPADKEHAFLGNLVRSISPQGPVILGMPSLNSQEYASPPSKEGHINCKDGRALRELLQGYFCNVFLFSMNDEVVHTGFLPMAHYYLAICAGVRR